MLRISTLEFATNTGENKVMACSDDGPRASTAICEEIIIDARQLAAMSDNSIYDISRKILAAILFLTRSGSGNEIHEDLIPS